MLSFLTSRRGFATRLAALIPGFAVSGARVSAAASPQAATGVKKLNYEGKPAGTGFITPLVIHNDTIYIAGQGEDRKSTRLNSSHRTISYAVFCLKKKIHQTVHTLL